MTKFTAVARPHGRAHHRVPGHVGPALADHRAHRGGPVGAVAAPGRQGAQQGRRDEVADRVDQQGRHRAEELDREAAEGRPGELGGGVGAGGEAVARLQLVAADDLGQERGVGDEEDHVREAEDEGDDDQLGHGQQVEPPGHRDGRDGERADQIRADLGAAQRQPLHDDPGGQADDQPGDVAAAAIMPISNGVASRTASAVSGRATPPTAEPRSLLVPAAHHRQNTLTVPAPDRVGSILKRTIVARRAQGRTH